MRRGAPVILTTVTVLVMTGCSTSTRTGVPILAVPEAPPRVVANFPPEPEPIPEFDPSATRSDEDPDAATPVEERADQPPQPAPPVDLPEPPVEAPDESDDNDAQLQRQLVSAPDQEFDQQNVRDTLDAAEQRLEALDRARLDSAERAQFDTARRFLQQARSALAAENFVFAFFLGEKARALADGL